MNRKKPSFILGYGDFVMKHPFMVLPQKKYPKYLKQEIFNSKEKIISQVKNDLNPKDLEYSLDDHLVDMQLDGSYNQLLKSIGFKLSRNEKHLAAKYVGSKNYIIKQVDKVVAEAWNQSKSEYKSATIDNSLALPKDNEPEEA